jgi:hypothetical protein
MKITLATLATPTDTSELYEFALNDMAELYETMAFASPDAAIAWAQTKVNEHNAQFCDEDEAEFRCSFALDVTEDRPMGTPKAVRFVWWTPSGEMGTSEPNGAFCLRIWEQEI